MNDDQPDKQLSEIDGLVKLCVEAAISSLEKYPGEPISSAAVMINEDTVAPVLFEAGMEREQAILMLWDVIRQFGATAYAYAGEVRFKHINLTGLSKEQANEKFKHIVRPNEDPEAIKGFAVTAASKDGQRRGITYELVQRDGKWTLGEMLTNAKDKDVHGPWASLYGPLDEINVDSAVLHALPEKDKK